MVSDWKSRYDVSDQGAWNAGVYGKPNSTWDIARAQEESERLRRSNWETPSAIPSAGGYQTTPVYPTATPSGTYHGDRSSGCLGILLTALVALALLCMLPLGMTLVQGWPIVAASAGLFGNGETRNLHTAHYEALSAEARALAAQPTSRLYKTYLAKAAPRWEALTPRQQAAVAATWIRYTRNPAAFDKLAPAQKAFVFAVFPGYLRSLANEGDKQATRDLEYLAARR